MYYSSSIRSFSAPRNFQPDFPPPTTMRFYYHFELLSSSSHCFNDHFSAIRSYFEQQRTFHRMKEILCIQCWWYSLVMVKWLWNAWNEIAEHEWFSHVLCCWFLCFPVLIPPPSWFQLMLRWLEFLHGDLKIEIQALEWKLTFNIHSCVLFIKN